MKRLLTLDTLDNMESKKLTPDGPIEWCGPPLDILRLANVVSVMTLPWTKPPFVRRQLHRIDFVRLVPDKWRRFKLETESSMPFMKF
jgi:hypothetical protein